MVNALERRESVEHRILLIGGGHRCQVTQSVFLGAALEALGLRWSERQHGRDGYYTDWLDTEESQRLLDYQRHGFEDYRSEMAQRLRWPRRLLRPLRPLLDPLLATVSGRLNRAGRGGSPG